MAENKHYSALNHSAFACSEISPNVTFYTQPDFGRW